MAARSTWSSLDDVLAAIAKETPHWLPLSMPRHSSKFRVAGAKIPRRTHRCKRAHGDHREHQLSSSPNRPSIQTPRLPIPWRAHPFSLRARCSRSFWSPGWNSIQSVNKFQSEIGEALRSRRSREFA